MRRIALAIVLAMTLGVSLAPTPASAATHYKNCAALQKKYPHGVGTSGAHDHTSGKPVTNFKHSTALYNANSKLDRDKDKIACEKR